MSTTADIRARLRRPAAAQPAWTDAPGRGEGERAWVTRDAAIFYLDGCRAYAFSAATRRAANRRGRC